jgi:aspartate-semialdehyde dehydrogenase
MTAIRARPAYHEALSSLNDRHLLRDLSYVGGRWVAAKTGASFKVTDPASSTTLAWVASLGREEALEAVDTAADAFAAWRSLLPQHRASILRQKRIWR